MSYRRALVDVLEYIDWAAENIPAWPDEEVSVDSHTIGYEDALGDLREYVLELIDTPSEDE